MRKPNKPSLLSIKVTDDQKKAYDHDPVLAANVRDTVRLMLDGSNSSVADVPPHGITHVIPRLFTESFTGVLGPDRDYVAIVLRDFRRWCLNHSHMDNLRDRIAAPVKTRIIVHCGTEDDQTDLFRTFDELVAPVPEDSLRGARGTFQLFCVPAKRAAYIDRSNLFLFTSREATFNPGGLLSAPFGFHLVDGPDQPRNLYAFCREYIKLHLHSIRDAGATELLSRHLEKLDNTPSD
jgi:hypothetical protein